jgi:ferritin-like protein
MSDYHEPAEEMSAQDRNIIRALKSFREEIEAIDWYHQRVAVCKEDHLKAILIHNRDEEIEHALMTLEWLRRNMDGWDEEMKTYLFTEGDITELEEEEEETGGEEKSPDLGIGSQKS